MIQVQTVDVLGPLPGEGACFVIAATNERMFGIQSSYADAEVAHGLLSANTPANPYEFMVETFLKLGVKIDKAELFTVTPCILGKMFMTAPNLDKPMRIVSSSPVAIMNSALAAKAPLEISEEMAGRIVDCTVEYHRLKGAMGQLFPLPLVDNTALLRLLSDLIDKIQFRQTSEV